MCSRATKTVSIFAPVDGTVDRIEENRMVIVPCKNATFMAPITGTISETIVDGVRMTTLSFRDLEVNLGLVADTPFVFKGKDVGTKVKAGQVLMDTIPDAIKEIHLFLACNVGFQSEDFLASPGEVVHSGRTIIGHGNPYTSVWPAVGFAAFLSTLIYLLHLHEQVLATALLEGFSKTIIADVSCFLLAVGPLLLCLAYMWVNQVFAE